MTSKAVIEGSARDNYMTKVLQVITGIDITKIDINHIYKPLLASASSVEKIGDLGDSSSVIEYVDTRISALETKIDKLIDYLEHWANVGNIKMDDIRENL